MSAEARSAGYAMANTYLALNSIMGGSFGMLPVKSMVYVTIMVAAVQRIVRNGLPDELRDSTPLPDTHAGYISRRAIAAATGLSRETVRRLVRELIAEGLLMEGPRGGLAARSGILAQPHVQRGLTELVTEFGVVSNRLLQLGVFRIGR